MNFMNTETARINRLIEEGGRTGLTELQFFAKEIVAWEKSPERLEQIKGNGYFGGQHDILDRKRTAIGPDGKLVPVDNLPNNRVIDNQYAKMVNQKTNYLLGKPFTITGENEQSMVMLAWGSRPDRGGVQVFVEPNQKERRGFQGPEGWNSGPFKGANDR